MITELNVNRNLLKYLGEIEPICEELEWILNKLQCIVKINSWNVQIPPESVTMSRKNSPKNQYKMESGAFSQVRLRNKSSCFKTTGLHLRMNIWFWCLCLCLCLCASVYVLFFSRWIKSSRSSVHSLDTIYSIVERSSRADTTCLKSNALIRLV